MQSWIPLQYLPFDHKGVLDKNHLRIKNPVVKAATTRSIIGPTTWNPKWGTRLLGYFTPDGEENNEDKKLPDHDDLDCLDDLEEAGLIDNLGSGLHPMKQLTKYGKEIAAQLRAHKSNGEHYFTFKPTN